MKAVLKHLFEYYIFTAQDLAAEYKMEGIPNWLEDWPQWDGETWYVRDDSTGREVELSEGYVVLLNNSILSWDLKGIEADNGGDGNGPDLILFTSERFNELLSANAT